MEPVKNTTPQAEQVNSVNTVNPPGPGSHGNTPTDDMKAIVEMLDARGPEFTAAVRHELDAIQYKCREPQGTATQKPAGELELAMERQLSAAVERVLQQTRGLKEPYRRQVLQRAMDSIEPADSEVAGGGKQKPQEPSEPEGSGRRLQLSKAQDEMKAIVAWLDKADFHMKLTVTLSHYLLMHEHVFKGDGLYEGDIGNDLLHDWEDDILLAVIPGESREIPTKDEWICHYLLAMMRFDS